MSAKGSNYHGFRERERRGISLYLGDNRYRSPGYARHAISINSSIDRESPFVSSLPPRAPSRSRHPVICLLLLLLPPPQRRKERTPGVYYSFRKVIFINLRPFLFFSLSREEGRRGFSPRVSWKIVRTIRRKWRKRFLL